MVDVWKQSTCELQLAFILTDALTDSSASVPNTSSEISRPLPQLHLPTYRKSPRLLTHLEPFEDSNANHGEIFT